MKQEDDELSWVNVPKPLNKYDVFVPVRLKVITNKFDKAIADSITETGKQLMEKLLTEIFGN